MKKIAFVGNSESPAKLLELFRKFTPNRSGIWGQLEGVDNYKEADVYGVIDYIPENVKDQVAETKSVFLGAHPETMQGYHNMSNYKGIKMYDCQYEFGFLEWWLNEDYDYLMSLKPPTKTKILGAIVSNAETQSYHKARIEWLKRFTDRDNISFDLHGRIQPRTKNMSKYYKGACGSIDPTGAAAGQGNDHMSGKEQVYSEHKYMIEFDATGKHYWSERVADCLLMWSMPVYWGGENLALYLPKESFVQLDIAGNGNEVLEAINNNYYEQALPYMAQARNLILNKYQIWPRIHEAIFGECK